MATSSITANFYCDDAKAAKAFVRMLVQPIKTAVRKKRFLPVVDDATVDDEDAFVKRFKTRWRSRPMVPLAGKRNWKLAGSVRKIEVNCHA